MSNANPSWLKVRYTKEEKECLTQLRGHWELSTKQRVEMNDLVDSLIISFAEDHRYGVFELPVSKTVKTISNLEMSNAHQVRNPDLFDKPTEFGHMSVNLDSPSKTPEYKAKINSAFERLSKTQAGVEIEYNRADMIRQLVVAAWEQRVKYFVYPVPE